MTGTGRLGRVVSVAGKSRAERDVKSLGHAARARAEKKKTTTRKRKE